MKKIIISLIILNYGICLFAWNPFKGKDKDFSGYYTNSDYTVLLGKYNSEYSGFVKRKDLEFSLKASVVNNKLTGLFNNKYPFTCELIDNNLSFKSNSIEVELSKHLTDYEYKGNFKTNDFIISFENYKGNNYKGIIKFDDNKYNFNGYSAGALFYGKIKIGSDLQSFYMLWEGNHVKFTSGGINKQLTCIYLENEKQEAIRRAELKRQRIENERLQRERDLELARQRAEAERQRKYEANVLAEKNAKLKRLKIQKDELISKTTVIDKEMVTAQKALINIFNGYNYSFNVKTNLFGLSGVDMYRAEYVTVNKELFIHYYLKIRSFVAKSSVSDIDKIKYQLTRSQKILIHDCSKTNLKKIRDNYYLEISTSTSHTKSGITSKMYISGAYSNLIMLKRKIDNYINLLNQQNKANGKIKDLDKKLSGYN